MYDFLEHYGVARRSGRYPWGSGENPYQRTSSFLQRVEDLEKQGLTQQEIAKQFGMSWQQLRAKKSAERNAERKANVAYVVRLKEKGWSNTAIAESMGRNESYVRTLLKPSENQLKDDVNQAKDILKAQLEKTGYLDVGAGTELHINDGMSREKLKAALAALEEEGYVVTDVHIPQPMSPDQNTTTKVLAKPGSSRRDIWEHRDDIETIASRQSDVVIKDYNRIKPPVSIKSKRIAVRYAEDGGEELDGLVEIRPGAKDLDMGGARYAQIRIAVDGTHYIKGMAVYSDDLPKGVDIRVNSNKKRGTPLKTTDGSKQVLKTLAKDATNPFEANITKQLEYTGKDGKRKLSALNIVYSEGDWNTWTKSLSSQFVSKQKPSFAKKQLDLMFGFAKDNFDEAKRITNPAVRKKILMSLADELDSNAVHLKAAGLPRQNWRVILPSTKVKPNEIYAPDYRNGEKVVLIRYPHAGIFEIPELTVNNRNPSAKKMFRGGNPLDAVVISHKVAEKLSGADFDGDTVMVIPNGTGRIKTSPSLQQLKNFDPKKAYPYREGMKVMNPKTGTGRAMGDITNLITDMTVMGASQDEIARAVKHSMVVIDAAKHKLDYKSSYKDNGIAALKKKYQGRSNAGASTLISKASSQARVAPREFRKPAHGGKIDPKTGKLVYTYSKKPGKKIVSTKMMETDDAFKLSSGTKIEAIYANYANSLKSLANQARKEYLRTKSQKYIPSARKVYSKEVSSLTSKLNLALKNAPLERKANRVANERIARLVQDNPGLDKDQLKKLKGRELQQARISVGAKKTLISITDREWDAIQAGAISQTRLDKIIANTDLTKLKERALPRTITGLTPAKESRAKSLAKAGYTRAEIADALGVSASTISRALGPKE